MLQALRDFLSLRPRRGDAGIESDQNQGLFITAANLTFSGVAVGAGFILNFLTDNFGGDRLWIALVIAVIFGGFVTFLALTDDKADKSRRGRATGGFVGFINTALLWISIYGVSSI